MVSIKAIQIVTPQNHKLQLQFEELKEILEADNIKNRSVVIISIAGAFRKGKSFLLNFFLRYLYAQYKKHNVTDWIGESLNGSELHGFKSRGGRKPETTGIWMWSEIFTHDFENGEKVAIILLDTQGIFDHRSSTKDCTATFAISMMLASVQCYNVMQNIQEDDLQHLELFTEYGRLAMEQSNEKPFQKLLFIVRDWPYADEEEPYGDGQFVVDELLNTIEDQTSEMRQLRKNIKSSFEQIGAFLMPYPGSTVARSKDFTSDLQQIDAEFIKYLKELVPLLFAPENLIVKKINGQKVRARDLVEYLQAYVNIFNSDELPDPRTVFMSTATTSNLLLYTGCLNKYFTIMNTHMERRFLNPDVPYFKDSDLHDLHETAKDEALQEFHEKRKMGTDELITEFQKRLTKDIKDKYSTIKKDNEKRQIDFNALAKAKLHVLYSDCLKLYDDSMQRSLRKVDGFFSDSELKEIHNYELNESLSKFTEERKLGDDDLIETFKSKLVNNIEIKYVHFTLDNDRKRRFVEDLKYKTEEAAANARAEARALAAEKVAAEAKSDLNNMMLYEKCMRQYKNAMHELLNAKTANYSQSFLEQKHDEVKRASLKQFLEKRDKGGQEILLESRLENDIDATYFEFKYQNDRKEKDIKAVAEKMLLKQMYEDLQNEIRNKKCTIQ